MDGEPSHIRLRDRPCQWLLPVEWLALFIGAILLLRSPLGMDDFFYQTRSGEYLLQTGRVLAVNLFSFTAPDHPWVNHAWLSGLLFHLVDSALGLPGVVALNAGCYLAAGLLFARNLRLAGAGPVARFVLILIYAAVVAKPYAVVRPWIFSHILFQTLLGLWLASRQETELRAIRKQLAAAVFILLLWLNVHGSFYVGWLMFALLLLSLRVRPSPTIRAKELLLWAALGVAVLFLNPYGTSCLTLPFYFLRGAVDAKAGAAYLAHLEEWASVLSFSLVMDYLAAVLFAMVSAAIVVRAINRRIQLSELPRILFFAASTSLILVAHRNDYFFLTASLCLFFPQGAAPGAANVSPGFLNRIRFHLDLVPSPKVTALWCVIPFVLFLAFSASKPPTAFLDPVFWPPKLMAHLQRDPFYREHCGFWDFDFTNIPIYRSDLHLKTFFDLREYCYPDEVVREFLAFHGSKDDVIVGIIRKWNLRYLVVRKGTLLEATAGRLLRGREPCPLSRNDAVVAAPHPGPLPADAGRWRCASLGERGNRLVRTMATATDFPLPADAGRGRGSSHDEQANYLVRTSATASGFPLPSLARGEGQGEGSRPWIVTASFRLSVRFEDEASRVYEIAECRPKQVDRDLRAR